MQEVILARHGENEYSARGLLNPNGDPDVPVELTEKGGSVQDCRAGPAARRRQPNRAIPAAWRRGALELGVANLEAWATEPASRR